MSKPTSKQLKFANGIVAGLGPSDAYRAAYNCSKWKPESVAKQAQKTLALPHIIPIIERGRAKAAENAIWTRETAIERAQNLNSWSYDILDRKRRQKPAKDGQLKDGYIPKDADTSFWNSFDRLNKLLGVKEGADVAPASFTVDYGLLLPPAYIAIHRDVALHTYTDYAFEGGRGSGKSSDIALEIPTLLLKDPTYNAVVLRKVANTLRKSVYAKLKWAIGQLGLADKFTCNKSTMEMTYNPTGQKIYFLGCDDEEKIKSFSCETGYTAIIWYEEFSQFTAEDVRSVNQSLSRGGSVFWRFYSWNPPRSKSNWVNKWVQEDIEGRCVHHSDYTMVPERLLGSQFIADAEELKAINLTAWLHEYMGEPVGTDGEVFQNLDIREITDEEIAALDWIRCGLDWGYHPDPFVFGPVGYDRKTKTVYILDEIFGTRLSDETAAEKAIELMTEDVVENGKTVRRYSPRAPHNEVYCDNAEPKSIASFRELGINALPVKKFKGSVDAGIKWLQTRYKIVIDPRRAPLSAQEFYAYEYEQDAEGSIQTYPDKNNHSIDKARYALAPLIAAKKEV
jgi:PBSX family phage terminase large subunit